MKEITKMWVNRDTEEDAPPPKPDWGKERAEFAMKYNDAMLNKFKENKTQLDISIRPMFKHMWVGLNFILLYMSVDSINKLHGLGNIFVHGLMHICLWTAWFLYCTDRLDKYKHD